MSVKKSWSKKLKKSFNHFFHPGKSANQRARLLHLEILIFFALIITVSSLLIRSYFFSNIFHSNILGFASDITAEQVIISTNKKRQALGLSDLTFNSQLSQAALAKGQDMFDNQYWAHVSPQGKQPWDFVKSSGYEYLVAGENLARDFSHTNDMVEAWMASPTHRANIVNPKFNEIGIAVINGTLNGFETTLVVQMFGSRASSPPQVDQVAFVDHRQAQASESEPVLDLSDSEAIPEYEYLDNTQLKNLDLRADQQFVLSELFVSEREQSERFLLSPMRLSKILFLSIICIMIFALIYDEFISGKMKLDRLVGDNIAHILFLVAVIFLLLFSRGGTV